MGAKKNVTVSGDENIKVVEAVDATATEENTQESEKKATKKELVRDRRSEKYKAARALVDKTKTYSAVEAIELAKKASYSKFVGTISADLVLKEVENRINVVFPHQTGKKIKVAIVDDALLSEIEAGKIDFDVLLTTPAYMPKLAKLAKILGPKGLMPNPKNDTIVTDPKKKQAELEGGKTILKTEKKAPLLHVALGKASLDSEKLAENFEALVKACDGKVLKASVSATMGVGVKVTLN